MDLCQVDWDAVKESIPAFPPGFGYPAVVSATKINDRQPSILKLSLTNRACTIACDPVASYSITVAATAIKFAGPRRVKAGSRSPMTRRACTELIWTTVIPPGW